MNKKQATYLTPGGILWKVLPDKEGNYLVLELRDGEKRSTSLALVELSSKKLLQHIHTLPKPWWIGVKEVVDNLVVLQGYKDGGSPELSGMYVVDKMTGKLCWEAPEVVYQGVYREGSFAVSNTNQTEGSLYCVDEKTGKRIGALTEQDLESNRKILSSIYEVPFLYNEDNVHYKEVASFILDSFQRHAAGPIEYIEHGNSVVISYYYKQEDKFRNMLTLINSDGEVELEECMIEASTGVGMSTFFVVNNVLVFSKEKTSLGLVTIDDD